MRRSPLEPLIELRGLVRLQFVTLRLLRFSLTARVPSGTALRFTEGTLLHLVSQGVDLGCKLSSDMP